MILEEGESALIKVSVITDEISQDFERALDVALEHNVRHVELRGLWDTNVADLTDDQVAKALDLIQERGMSVVAIAGPVFKCHLSAEQPGKRRGYLWPYGRCDHRGAPGASSSARSRWPRPSAPIWSAPLPSGGRAPTAEVYDSIEKHLREALRRTTERGLRLILENEHACFIGTADESIEILKRIDSPSFGLIWDPGNAAVLEPAARVFPGGYERIKAQVGIERILHVHLKDPVTAEPRTRFTEFGKGEIDYRGQLAALVNDGYTGAVSMETHWQGPGMSREESTRLCLDGLWRLIDEAGVRSHFQ